MKIKDMLTITILFLLSSTILFAQEKPPTPDEPDEPYEVEVPEIEFEHFFKLSEDEEKKLLKNLNKELKAELTVIKNANKERYFDFLRESQFRNIRIPFMAKRDKAMHERESKIFEAEIKAEALAVKYEKAREADKRKIKSDLRNELSKLFEIKEERRREEVAELEQELKELRKSLSIRQNNKKEIIERRIRELLDEDEYLDWD